MSGFADLFGSILYWLYENAGRDYGIALIIFTFFIKLILMPLNVKQMKSSMRMQELQPELKKLQDRYKDDREKLNEEMVKFFKEKNHNPANGCLGILVQMPILWVIFQVFRNPISHMLPAGGAFIEKIKGEFNVSTEAEIIFNYTKEIGKALVDKQIIPLDLSERILDIQQGMNFLGIFDLARTPAYKYAEIMQNPEIYVPHLFLILLLIVVTMISTKFMTPKKDTDSSSKAKDDTSKSMENTTKTMTYAMPIMLAFFSFQVPAGLTLYWLMGSVFQIFQQMYIRKTLKDDTKNEIGIKEEINDEDIKEEINKEDSLGKNEFNNEKVKVNIENEKRSKPKVKTNKKNKKKKK